MDKFWQALLIRPGERASVVYFFTIFFLVEGGLSIGNAVANTLFLKRYGVENLPLMYGLIGIALACSAIIYAATLARLSAERGFQRLLGLLGCILLLCWWGISTLQLDILYPLYFMLYEIFSELLVIHVSLYLSQNLDFQESKRLTSVIMAGSQVGIVFGGFLLVGLVSFLNIQHFLFIWFLFIAVTFLLVRFWHKRRGVSPFFRFDVKKTSGALHIMHEVGMGIRLMHYSPLLKAAMASLFFLVITFYLIAYLINVVFSQSFTNETEMAQFFGILTTINSVVGLLLQVLLTNRLLQWFGVKNINLIFPVTSLASLLALFFSFSLPAAVMGSFNRDALMNAFRDPVWEIMLKVLPASAQGRIRAMILAVVIPLALLVSGLGLWLLQSWFDTTTMVWVGMATALVYGYCNWRMNIAYLDEIITYLKRKLSFKKNRDFLSEKPDSKLLQTLRDGVYQEDPQVALAFANTLVQAFPEQAVTVVMERLKMTADITFYDELLCVLTPLGRDYLEKPLLNLLPSAAPSHAAAILWVLFHVRSPAVAALPSMLLLSSCPRTQASGVYGAYVNGFQTTLWQSACEVWNELLQAQEVSSNLLGLRLLRSINHQQGNSVGNESPVMPPDFPASVLRLWLGGDGVLQQAILKTLRLLPTAQFAPLLPVLGKALQQDDPALRLACVAVCGGEGHVSGYRLLHTALDDPHPDVRKLAVNQIQQQVGNQGLKPLLQRGTPRMQSAVVWQLLKDEAEQSYLQDVATCKAVQAQQFAMVWMLLKQMQTPDDAQKLLLIVVKERVNAVLQIALQALQTSRNADAIKVIRAGLETGDRCLQGSAREALLYLPHRGVQKTLCGVLEQEVQVDRQQFPDVLAAVRWCSGQPDPWLQGCAQYVLMRQT